MQDAKAGRELRFSIGNRSRERRAALRSTLLLRCGEQKTHNPPAVKYWEIIADNLSKAGWSWGCVSAIDREGRTIWIADAHRDDGRRFVVRADEKLTAFLELERAVCIHLLSEQC
jgi:hypothetical protein